MTAPALRTYPSAPRSGPGRGPPRAPRRRSLPRPRGRGRRRDARRGRPRRTTCTRSTARRSAPPGPSPRERLTGRLRALLGAGFVSPPAWRGDRRFFSRRVGDQEHAVVVVAEGDDEHACCSTRSPSIPPAPRRSTRGSRRRRGTWWRTRCRRVAPRRACSTSLDVATGELVDGPIDRARYSPVAWLPGGEAFYYVRRLPPEALPQDEAQYHRRIWLHRLGTSADDDVEVFGAGLDHTSYYGVLRLPRRSLALVSASAGTAPRTDVWIADLTAAAPEAPSFVEVAVGIDAETGAWVARDGRLYVHTTSTRPAAASRSPTRRRRASSTGRPCCAQDPTAVLEDVAFIDGGGDDTAPIQLLASWRRHAVVGGQRARPAHRRAPAGRVRAARARLDLGTGDTAGRRSGGLVLLHGPHDADERAPVRRAHRADHVVGRPSRARRRPPGRPRPGRSRSPAPTARSSAPSSSRVPTPWTATAAR